MPTLTSSLSTRDLLLLFTAGVVSTICNITFNSTLFFDHKPFAQLESIYSRSQYVLGDGKEVTMGDGDVYAYAGTRYVAGTDVTSINFEHPPLAKYLYGLSYTITGMQNWVLIPLLLLTPLLMWQLSSYLFSNHWFRWLSVVLLLTHTAYMSNSTQTMLDFPQMFFLLIFQIFFCKLENQKNSYRLGLIFGISAGLTWLAKYPFPLILMLHALNYVWLVHKKVPIKILATSVFAAAATYLVGYTSFFLHGNSLIDWVRFEWWRVQWYMGKTDNPSFMLFKTLFTGTYPAWWSDEPKDIVVAYWNISWPLITLAFGTSALFVSKTFSAVKIYLYWAFLALFILSLKVAEDRYLIPLLPAFALGASFTIKQAVALYRAKRVAK